MNNQEIAQKWKVSSVTVDGILADAAPSAPLVAVSEAVIMKLIDAQYLNGSIRLTWENNNGELTLTDVCKRFTAGILEAAGQVAPQATVEPLTDERALFSKWYSEDAPDESRITVHDMALEAWSARALLAATPPTSKATPSYKSNYPGFERLCNFLPPEFMWGDNLLPHHMDHIVSAVESEATSKADTGEALPHPQTSIRSKGDYYDAGQMRDYRNAALEEAAKICMDIAEDCGANCKSGPLGVDARLCEMRIRTLKSATPSTIKADHINDAVEMVKPTGEQL